MYSIKCSWEGDMNKIYWYDGMLLGEDHFKMLERIIKEQILNSIQSLNKY